ncbi:conjugative transposon protein TraJ [Mucilaginibacter sp. PPCGB 2223]|uniref:conjugative transposon protein TraJ n=1 Tax=Mucilaginibacter sp. PPCGB 2223 TaxID=1886027 RepID=UPI00082410C5|nr:conjugative transposon protein TraJ [Mucilaginibacter sp. PPCGB 2223]OCX52776.1 conjugative transposon protein TraJ [Mucilaginibacter sp. PPCGB 2223]
MKQKVLYSFSTLLLLFTASQSHAQDITSSLKGMQPVLNNVYNQMIPLCSNLIDVGRGIAGFGALWYIASRVWKQIARAEAVDFYPLLRPFALGMAILMFPAVISLMNGVMQPIVSATGAMVTNSDNSIALLLKQKQEAIKNSSSYQMYIGDDGNGDRAKWYAYTHPDDPNDQNEGTFSSLGNDVKFWMDKQSYNFKNNIKQWMSEVLQVLYAAAILCINVIRTFYLIVLAILGPLVFGFAVFDGLQHTLTQWIARYINIFLWLPIANIFGAIIGQVQQQMLQLDINQIQSNGDTFFSQTDLAYLIFLCIGIVGYFSVPSVANYVIHAHGGNGLLNNVTNVTQSVANTTISATRSAAGVAGERFEQARSNILNAPGDFMEGYRGVGNQHQKDKLSGK